MQEKRHTINAHITGTVWKIVVEVGAKVQNGDTIMILESMKMEMPIEVEEEGTVEALLVSEGQPVQEGQGVAVLMLR